MRARSASSDGDAHLVGAGAFDDLEQVGELGLDLDPLALQFDDQQRGGVARIAGVHRRLGRLDGQRIHDLHGAGQQAGGHDLRHRVARGRQRRVGGQHGAIAFRLGQQPQRDLQRDAKEPLRPDKEAGQIRPDALQAVAAELDHFAVGQHGLDAQHVVGGHAVFQTVRAAGVEGDVAADGADQLAGRVGRIVETVRGHGAGDIQIDHARFNHGNRARRCRCAGCG